MMKYCVDCKYAEKDIRNKCRTWVCTHPDLLNIVSKRPEDCEYVRTIGVCGGQGKFYETLQSTQFTAGMSESGVG